MPEAETQHHDTRWRKNGDNFLSTGTDITSLRTVLETLGMATVYIRDNSNWSEGGRLEVTQYVNQSMGFSCEIWRRCFVSDQRSQAAPNFLLSQPVAAD